jgi:hypothetical protein
MQWQEAAIIALYKNIFAFDLFLTIEAFYLKSSLNSLLQRYL